MSRRALHKLYWKLQGAIAPGLRDSQQDYEDVLNVHAVGVSRWLDVGCGHHLLPPWRFEQEQALVGRSDFVVGIDYDHLSLAKHKTITNRLRGNISKLPFPDQTFDLVTANMVFEHLDNPEAQLKEIYRVLRIDGRLIFHTPNKFGYSTLMARAIPESLKHRLVYLLQERNEDDVFPAFYKINSVADINRLAKQSGFEVLDIELTNSFAQFIVVPPLAVLELFWLRFLMTSRGRALRPYLIAVLQKAS